MVFDECVLLHRYAGIGELEHTPWVRMHTECFSRGKRSFTEFEQLGPRVIVTMQAKSHTPAGDDATRQFLRFLVRVRVRFVVLRMHQVMLQMHLRQAGVIKHHLIEP